MAQTSALDDEHEEVLWQVQPNGVTLYVTALGNTYRVRNQYEVVVIAKADRPELQALGYIPSKEN